MCTLLFTALGNNTQEAHYMCNFIENLENMSILTFRTLLMFLCVYMHVYMCVYMQILNFIHPFKWVLSKIFFKK